MTRTGPLGAASAEVAATLRPLREGDQAAVLDAFRASADMGRQGLVRTAAEAHEYVLQLSDPDGRHRAFAVCLDDQLVGLVALTLDPANRLGWFYYWLHVAHRGQGLASRAAATVATWALAEGGCERLELGHRVDNPASGRVARAAGFVPEGQERDKFLIEGRRVDVLTYGRLRTDPVPHTPTLPWSVRP